MKQLLSKRWIVLLLVLMVLFASAACQAGGSSPAITQVPEIVATETIAPATVPETVSVEGDVVFGSGPFNFPDTIAGLADLSSYQANLMLSFEGTRPGQPSQLSKTYVMLSVKEPAAFQLAIEKTGDLSDLDTV